MVVSLVRLEQQNQLLQLLCWNISGIWCFPKLTKPLRWGVERTHVGRPAQVRYNSNSMTATKWGGNFLSCVFMELLCRHILSLLYVGRWYLVKKLLKLHKVTSLHFLFHPTKIFHLFWYKTETQQILIFDNVWYFCLINN